MDIDEINDHIHKLKCGSTDWQSVEKLAALCTGAGRAGKKSSAGRNADSSAAPAFVPGGITPQKQIRKASSWKRPAPRPLEVDGSA